MEGKFYLRKKDVKGYSTIYLYVTIDKKQLYTSTGLKVAERDWNGKRMMFKDNTKNNAILDTYNKVAGKFVQAVESGRVMPDNAALKEFIRLNLAPAEEPEKDPKTEQEQVEQVEAQPIEEKPKRSTKTPFFYVIDKFLKECPERLNSDGERICERRIKMYYYTRQRLVEFQRSEKKELSFQNFDYQTLEHFQTFLTKKNLANNTICRYFKMLHVILRYAENLGIAVNQDWRKYKNTKQNRKDSVVLNQDEIQRVIDYQPINECEANVKKLFLIGIHTGLRFGDFSELQPGNIDFNNMTINKIMNKTGRLVTIPLHPFLADMLKNEELPHKITDVRFNAYIKQLMKKIGLDEVIQIKKIVGGKRIVEYKQKWELVSSHTCRRSFATNLYKSGVNPSIIMLCTGHKDLDSFMRYIILDDTDKLQVVRNLWSNTAV